jgi:hypothetical protein
MPRTSSLTVSSATASLNITSGNEPVNGDLSIPIAHDVTTRGVRDFDAFDVCPVVNFSLYGSVGRGTFRTSTSGFNVMAIISSKYKYETNNARATQLDSPPHPQLLLHLHLLLHIRLHNHLLVAHVVQHLDGQLISASEVTEINPLGLLFLYRCDEVKHSETDQT